MFSRIKEFLVSNKNFILCMLTMYLGYFFGYCFVTAVLDKSWWRVFLYLYLTPYWLYRSFSFWSKAVVSS
jgi:hypothetical protein